MTRSHHEDALPEGDLVFFLVDLIPQIDLTPFHQYYAQGRCAANPLST